MSRLSDIGEDALVERLVRLVPVGDAAEGPGDDCAVVDEGGERLELLKTDGMVEGVHFLKGADAKAVGWKAVARVILVLRRLRHVRARKLLIYLSCTHWVVPLMCNDIK